MLNFRVFESTDDLVSAAAEEVLWVVEHSSRAVVALSGGSTPRPLYERLGGEYWERLSGRPVVWVTGDERCVPPDHDDSNARMIRETLFRNGTPDKHHLLSFDTSAPDIASRFEEAWRDLGIYEIDLAILGVGDDGHTASLFPGTAIMDITDRVAAVVEVPRLAVRRVSITIPHLRGARRKMILATGRGKREMIERVGRGESFPITEVIGAGGEAWWFVDREAYPG